MWFSWHGTEGLLGAVGVTMQTVPACVTSSTPLQFVATQGMADKCLRVLLMP